jgi:hypothetical protein
LDLLIEKKCLNKASLNDKLDKKEWIGFFLKLPIAPKTPLLICAAQIRAEKKIFFGLTDGSVVTLDFSDPKTFQAELNKYLPQEFMKAMRLKGNEASAIGSLRTLQAAQAIFIERDASQEYGTLKQLVAAQFIDSVLATGKKHGYSFKVHVGDKEGKNKEYKFHVTATPIEPGKTGKRCFYTDQSGVIRFETGKDPTEKSPPLGKTPGGKAEKNNVRGTDPDTNEAKAVTNLRILNASQALHIERSKDFCYGALAQLSKSNLISDALASGKTWGYIYKVHPGDKDGKNKEYEYHIAATPIEPGKTGKRYFYTDQSGVIRFSTKGPATKKSTPLGQ